MAKKKTQQVNELEDLKSKLEAKETEVKGLQTRIEKMENLDPLSKKIYYTFYADVKRDVLAEIIEDKSEVKETDWHSFVDRLTKDHDIDLAFFFIYGCIDLFQVPFTPENAKKYFRVCLNLGNIIRYCQG